MVKRKKIKIVVPNKIFRVIKNSLAVIAGLYALIQFYNVLPINSDNLIPFLKINLMITILILVAIIVFILGEGEDNG